MTGWPHNRAVHCNNDSVFAARQRRKAALPVPPGAMAKVGKAGKNLDP